MWFDEPPGQTDTPSGGAVAVAYAAALFAIPGVWFALIALEPLSGLAAAFAR